MIGWDDEQWLAYFCRFSGQQAVSPSEHGIAYGITGMSIGFIDPYSP